MGFIAILATLTALLVLAVELKQEDIDDELKKSNKNYSGLNADQFFRGYVSTGVPLLMKSSAKELFPDGFDIYNLKTVPHSYTTYIDVKKKDEDLTSFMSFSQFLREHYSKQLYIDSPIPDVIKSQLHLPQNLNCKPILEGLRHTRLIFRSGEWRDPKETNTHHNFICQMSGVSSYFIFNPRSSSYQSSEGYLEEELNEREKNTTPNKLKLDPGDCLYLPSEWVQQKNTSGTYISLRISWTLASNASSIVECGKQSKKELLMLKFHDDPPPNIFSLLKFNDLHHFIKEYYLSTSETMNLENFGKKIPTDEHLSGIVDWDEECKDVAKEMFGQMDVNSDGVVSVRDFDEMTYEDMNYLEGKVEDRLADFQDIMEDQKSEKKSCALQGSLFDVAKNAASETKELRKFIEDGFSDIFKDIEMLETGSTTPREPGERKLQVTEDEEMEKIKRMERKIRESISTSSSHVDGKDGNPTKDEL